MSGRPSQDGDVVERLRDSARSLHLDADLATGAARDRLRQAERGANEAADEIERLREDLERAYQKDDAKTREINILVPENRKLSAEIELLRARVERLEGALRSHDGFIQELTKDFIGSFNGAELQAMLVSHGLYRIEPFDPDIHRDRSGAAEPGDDFYIPTNIAREALSTSGSDGK